MLTGSMERFMKLYIYISLTSLQTNC